MTRRPDSLQADAELIWQMHEAGAMERTAALLHLSLIYQRHPNPGIRRLCVRVAETIGGLPLHTSEADHG